MPLSNALPVGALSGRSIHVFSWGPADLLHCDQIRFQRVSRDIREPKTRPRMTTCRGGPSKRLGNQTGPANLDLVPQPLVSCLLKGVVVPLVRHQFLVLQVQDVRYHLHTRVTSKRSQPIGTRNRPAPVGWALARTIVQQFNNVRLLKIFQQLCMRMLARVWAPALTEFQAAKP